jgi:hypothetical protein
VTPGKETRWAGSKAFEACETARETFGSMKTISIQHRVATGDVRSLIASRQLLRSLELSLLVPLLFFSPEHSKEADNKKGNSDWDT